MDQGQIYVASVTSKGARNYNNAHPRNHSCFDNPWGLVVNDFINRLATRWSTLLLVVSHLNHETRNRK